MVLDKDNYDPYILYQYGLYVNSVAAGIKNLDKKKVTLIYNELPIHTKKDIVMNGRDIASILNREPGKYIKDIFNDIEEKVVNSKLDNNQEVLSKYILDNYQ